MCGRYTIKTPLQVIADLFEVERSHALLPRYNVAPTQDVPVVFLQEHRRDLTMMRWGLVPYWAKDPKIGASLINARAESVSQKPAFRDAFKRRRCLIVADGFFEWRKTESGKQPYWIHLKDEEPFAFAGLWEHWRGEQGEITSCTIVTTNANDFVAELHDRMPVILPREGYAPWLDPSSSSQELQALLKPYDSAQMGAHAVSNVVNFAKNDDPSCITPLGQQLRLSLRKV